MSPPRFNLLTICKLIALPLTGAFLFAGCAGSGKPPPSPRTDLVFLRLTAEHFKLNGIPNCGADTGGKVVISGVPLADDTCEIGRQGSERQHNQRIQHA
jgi:hypothetical protein